MGRHTLEVPDDLEKWIEERRRAEKPKPSFQVTIIKMLYQHFCDIEATKRNKK